MIEYLPYIWIAVALISVGVEASTAALVSIWFIPSALIALALSLLGLPAWVQVLVFFVLSGILLIMCKTIFRKFFKVRTTPTNTDLLIGKKAIVTSAVDNLRQCGAVRIDGKEWTARSSDDSVVFPEGELVTVERIEGVKLICK